MTARKSQSTADFGDSEEYSKRWKYAPKSLSEQDVEWDRQERIQAQAEARARQRVNP